jgi:hypothetical protein
MSSVYTINKGVNRPITFKGLKAQYIWYLAGGLMGLLILFAILYICGVNTFVSLGVILVLGGVIIGYVYRMSDKHGQYGMMKKIARKGVPTTIKSYSRKEYIHLKK